MQVRGLGQWELEILNMDRDTETNGQTPDGPDSAGCQNLNFGTRPFEVAILGRVPGTQKMWPNDLPNEEESKAIKPVRLPLVSPGLSSCTSFQASF